MLTTNITQVELRRLQGLHAADLPPSPRPRRQKTQIIMKSEEKRSSRKIWVVSVVVATAIVFSAPSVFRALKQLFQ